MIYTCKIDLADYRHAMWLHVKPRKVLAILGITLLVIFAAAIVFILFNYIATGQGFPQLCVVAGVMAYFTFAILWWRARITRTYHQSKLLHEPFTFEATDSHLVTKANFGESKIPWESFHKWKADARLVLLYQSDVLFHMFPRQAFVSAAEFQSFRDMIATKISATN